MSDTSLIDFEDTADPCLDGIYTIDELNRLFAAASTAPGNIGEVPASLWYPAFLLCVLDVQITPKWILQAPYAGFDAAASTLAVRYLVHRLHARTSAALAALGEGRRDFLFPWDMERGPGFSTFHNRHRIVFRDAGLEANRDYFRRMIATGAALPLAIEAIDLSTVLPVRRAPLGWGRPLKPDAMRDPAPAPTIPWEINPQERSPESSIVVHGIRPRPEDADRTVRAFFETVYVPRRLKLPGTIKTCRAAINRLYHFACCEVLLSQLSDDLIERLICWQSRAGYSPFTIKGTVGTVLSVWNYAWRKRFVETQWRDIERVRLPKLEPECWSVEEVGRILQAASKVEGTVAGIAANSWWLSLISVIYDTGLRIGALMKVERRDVDLDGRWIKARFENQKQKADQTVPISEETASLIRAMDADDRRLLFPWPIVKDPHRSELIARFRTILLRAGLPIGSRDLFHKLRRTNGTYVTEIAGEEAAMRQLGHSEIQKTRRYVDRRKLTKPRIVDSMPRPMWKPPALLEDGRATG